jgi:hypothetical protein
VLGVLLLYQNRVYFHSLASLGDFLGVLEFLSDNFLNQNLERTKKKIQSSPVSYVAFNFAGSIRIVIIAQSKMKLGVFNISALSIII